MTAVRSDLRPDYISVTSRRLVTVQPSPPSKHPERNGALFAKCSRRACPECSRRNAAIRVDRFASFDSARPKTAGSGCSATAERLRRLDHVDRDQAELAASTGDWRPNDPFYERAGHPSMR